MAVDGLIDCHIHYMPSVFGSGRSSQGITSCGAWSPRGQHGVTCQLILGGLEIALHVVDTEAFTFGHFEYPIVDLQTGEGIPSNSCKFTKLTEG